MQQQDTHDLQRALRAGVKFEKAYPKVFREMRDTFLKINLKQTRSMVKPIHLGLYAFLNQPEDQHGNSLRLWVFINHQLPTPCLRCGGPIVKWRTDIKGPAHFCSSTCGNASSQRQDQRRKTCIAKYGVDNPSKAPKVVRKIRRVFRERYGCDHALQRPESIKKFRQTSKLRYGVSHPMKNEEVAQRLKEAAKQFNSDPVKVAQKMEKWQRTCMEKYGVRHHFQDPHIYHKALRSGAKTKKVTINGKALSVQGDEPKVLKSIEAKIAKIETGADKMPALFYTGRDGKEHRYYPDARLLTMQGNKVLLEVKSGWTKSLDIPTLKRKYLSAVLWCEDHNHTFVVAVTKGKTGVTWNTLRCKADIVRMFRQ